MRKTLLTSTAMALSAALVLTACGSDDGGSDDAETDAAAPAADDGATEPDGTDAPAASLIDTDECVDPEAATAPVDGPIKVGWTAPLSGPLATAVGAVLAGMEARFAQVNEAGGIDGHEVEVLSKDDAFNPEKAKSNVAELIEVDQVHVLELFGSGQLSAVADDQNIACVPLLFAQAGVPEFRDAEAYPWTTEYLPSAAVETALIVQRLQDQYPDGATVALAVNPTDSGVSFADGFKAAAEGTGLEIVAEADLTDPDAAATTLSTSDAQVLVDAGVTTDCLALSNAVGRVGWEPETFIQPSNCVDGETLYAPAGDAADGQIVLKWLKDPDNPLYAADEAVTDYQAAIDAAGITDADNYTVNGWVLADMMVDVFETAAASDLGLSRVGIMEAARTQTYSPPMFIDGIQWQMSPEASLGIIGMQPFQWNASEGQFVEAGNVVELAVSPDELAG